MNVLKLNLMLLVGTLCVLPVARAEPLRSEDPRSDWHCAYPYTETNCQQIVEAWSNDNLIPREFVLEGHECSGCESFYFTDHLKQKHLLYAKCLDRFGSRLGERDLVAPIYKYRESVAQTPGWNIVDWGFEKCFETWECGDYCSLETNPPTCLRYHTTNWGLHVPALQGPCNFGSGDTEPQTETETQPASSSTSPPPIKRDSTWIPVY